MQYWSVHCSSTGFSVHHDSLVSIKQQTYEHVQLCCPDMESLAIEKCKCKPTANTRPVLESLHAYWCHAIGVSVH